MKFTLAQLILSLVALIGLSSFSAYLFLRGARFVRDRRRGSLKHAINTSLPGNVGSSRDSRRYLSGGVITPRYSLVKVGADDQHVVLVAATSDRPVGVCTDESAEAEDPVSVELSSVTSRTLPLIAAGAIALNVAVYSDGTGLVMGKPTAPGTYWKVGHALTIANQANDPVEVALMTPRKLTVVAALTSAANATTAAVDLTTSEGLANALKTAYNALYADFITITNALQNDGDVSIL